MPHMSVIRDSNFPSLICATRLPKLSEQSAKLIGKHVTIGPRWAFLGIEDLEQAAL